MSVKSIIMFLGMNNTRLERKILIILDFENEFLPTYLPQWVDWFLYSILMVDSKLTLRSCRCLPTAALRK